MLNQLMFQLQQKIKGRNNNKICRQCREINTPLREVSILNIGFYILLGIVAGVMTKSFWCILIPFALAVINSFMVKPKCRSCRSLEIEEPTQEDYEDYYERKKQEEVEEEIEEEIEE